MRKRDERWLAQLARPARVAFRWAAGGAAWGALGRGGEGQSGEGSGWAAGTPRPRRGDAAAVCLPAQSSHLSHRHVLPPPSQGFPSSRPSGTALAAASGSAAAVEALEREAAAHGMSVEQYRAYQDDLALQEAIQVGSVVRLGAAWSRALGQVQSCPSGSTTILSVGAGGNPLPPHANHW